MTTRECVKCALPDRFPGIRFGDDGECNYCASYDLQKGRQDYDASLLKDAFDSLIRRIASEGGSRKYDCLVLYSGGKDSTSMLMNLRRKYDLKILAHTVDNGFLSKMTWQNIERVTQTLGVDLKVTKPRQEFAIQLFRNAMTQEMPFPKELRALASTVCQSCIGLVVGTSLFMAIDTQIPLVFAGFTPGQMPSVSIENFWKSESCMFLSDEVHKDDPLNFLKILADPIREKYGKEADQYYYKDQYVERGTFIPKVLFPFQALWDYNEDQIYEEIAKIGWQKPLDVDSCSTNCMLNSAGIVAFRRRYGYHPYVGEMSSMVRQGKITREHLVKMLGTVENKDALQISSQKLRLPMVD